MTFTRLAPRLRDIPYLSLLAFWISLPFARPSLFAVAGQPVQASDLFLVVAHVAAAPYWLSERMWSRDVRGFLVPAAGYLIVLALSTWAVGAWSWPAAIKLGAYALLVLMPVVTAVVVDTPARFEGVVAAATAGFVMALVAALGSAVAFYLAPAGWGALAVCTWGALPPSTMVPRLCWPFRNPNMLASYLVFTMPLLFLLGRPLHRPALVALCASAVVLALTLSAEVGGAAIALAVVLWAGESRFRWRRPVLAAGAGAIALLLAIAVTSYPVPPGAGHLPLPLSGSELRLWDGPRVSVWKASATSIAAHPVLGRGYGRNIAQVTDPRAAGYHRDWDRHPPVPSLRDAHNVWLNVLGQAGLIGLAAFLVLVARVGRRLAHIDHAPVRRALMGTLAGGFLYGGLFHALEETRHLWGLTSLVIAAGVLWNGRPRPAC